MLKIHTKFYVFCHTKPNAKMHLYSHYSLKKKKKTIDLNHWHKFSIFFFSGHKMSKIQIFMSILVCNCIVHGGYAFSPLNFSLYFYLAFFLI